MLSGLGTNPPDLLVLNSPHRVHMAPTQHKSILKKVFFLFKDLKLSYLLVIADHTVNLKVPFLPSSFFYFLSASRITFLDSGRSHDVVFYNTEYLRIYFLIILFFDMLAGGPRKAILLPNFRQIIYHHGYLCEFPLNLLA